MWTCNLVSCTLGFIPQCSPSPRVAIWCGAGRSAVRASAGPSDGSQCCPSQPEQHPGMPTLNFANLGILTCACKSPGLPKCSPWVRSAGSRDGLTALQAIQGRDREVSRRGRGEVRVLPQPCLQRPGYGWCGESPPEIRDLSLSRRKLLKQLCSLYKPKICWIYQSHPKSATVRHPSRSVQLLQSVPHFSCVTISCTHFTVLLGREIQETCFSGLQVLIPGYLCSSEVTLPQLPISPAGLEVKLAVASPLKHQLWAQAAAPAACTLTHKKTFLNLCSSACYQETAILVIMSGEN